MKTQSLEKDTIIKNHLGDFDTFLVAVKEVLGHPEKFGLSVE